jgi:hypothetical protein
LQTFCVNSTTIFSWGSFFNIGRKDYLLTSSIPYPLPFQIDNDDEFLETSSSKTDLTGFTIFRTKKGKIYVINEQNKFKQLIFPQSDEVIVSINSLVDHVLFLNSSNRVYSFGNLNNLIIYITILFLNPSKKRKESFRAIGKKFFF